MPLPAGFPYPLNQVIEIPLEQIIPNPNQPRKLEDKEAIQLLSASMRAKGQEVAARVRPLTEEERTAYREIHPAQQMGDGKISGSDHLLDPGPWVMLIGGHGRREAALANQVKTLKCTVEDIAPEETLSKSARDNNMRPMHWWEWYLIIEGVNNVTPKSQRDLADELGQSQTRVNRTLKVTKVLNSAARALVLENLQKTLKNGDSDGITKNKAFSIKESHLLALADLGDPDRVQPALQSVLDDYLTPDQTQKLVEHMKAGNHADTFNPVMKMAKSKTTHPTHSHHTHPAHLSATGGLSLSGDAATTHSQSASPNPGTSPIANAVGNPLAGTGGSTPPESSPKESSGTSTHDGSQQTPSDNWFWKWIVGIKFIKEVRSKLNKGEPLTGWEKVYALFYGIYEKTKPVLKAINQRLKNTLGKKNYNALKTVFWIILIWALFWGAGKFWQIVVTSPLHWLEKRAVWALDGGLWASKAVTPVPTTVSTPSPAGIFPTVIAIGDRSSPSLKVSKVVTGTQQAPAPKPIVLYQPAVSFSTTASPSNASGTLYDPKILELEIAALSDNVVVKDHPMTPDEGMPGDVALSRMQDITDPDKYTMMIGDGKQIIQSANSTNTTLTVSYKSSDPLGGFLDGSKSPMNFLWEDVKYIHANEIDVETKIPPVIYQCSLVVSGSKYPLTIQCASAEDLEHLVSTMQYFIRHSRLGRDTALGGMPYPLQGVRLNDDGLAEKLWANSPVDKAGLKLGEIIWSVDKNTADQPDHQKLLADLAALAPGSHDLFVVSPADREQGHGDVSLGRSKAFNPKRRKVTLMSL